MIFHHNLKTKRITFYNHWLQFLEMLGACFSPPFSLQSCAEWRRTWGAGLDVYDADLAASTCYSWMCLAIMCVERAAGVESERWIHLMPFISSEPALLKALIVSSLSYSRYHVNQQPAGQKNRKYPHITLGPFRFKIWKTQPLGSPLFDPNLIWNNILRKKETVCSES